MIPYIQKNFPLGVKEQLFRQIYAMIREGKLVSGQMLMSAADLGRFLKINRNTVAQVYKELEAQGLVKVVKGSGTYVETVLPSPWEDEVRGIFARAWDRARATGAPAPEIREIFLTGLLRQGAVSAAPKQVILVDCNHEVLETLDGQIRGALPPRFLLTTRPVLIQEIQADPDLFMRLCREADLLACGMNHMAELMDAAPELPVTVAGFLIKTDFRIMNRILQLPPGTRVGYCCISQKSARAFFSTTAFSSGNRLVRCHAGMDDARGAAAMLETCDLVFATHYVHDRLVAMNRPKAQIIRVDLEIDRESIDFILSSLTQGG